jgi:hypothetical protein
VDLQGSEGRRKERREDGAQLQKKRKMQAYMQRRTAAAEERKSEKSDAEARGCTSCIFEWGCASCIFPVLPLYITFILQIFFFLSGVEWVKQNRLFFTHTTPVYDS